MMVGLFLIIFMISTVGTYYVRRIALKSNILDVPNERSSHFIATPRVGGIAIALTWFLSITYLFFRNEIDSTLFYVLLCGLPITAIGLVDDIITISPKVRLIIQVASATIAILLLGGIDSIDIGFKIISIPYLFSFFAIIGIVWFINLFNFLDGIDGYVSAEVIFIGIASFVLFGFTPPLLLATITAGFIVWNWQPAKIFMGDVGSTLLGFTIGVFAIYYQNSGDSSIVIWLMLISLFWFDATITLFRRWRNREKLSDAHKKHAYQRIVQSGYSHQRTVLSALGINCVVFILTLLAIIYPRLLLVLFLLDILFLYLVFRFIDFKFPFEKDIGVNR